MDDKDGEKKQVSGTDYDLSAFLQWVNKCDIVDLTQYISRTGTHDAEKKRKWDSKDVCGFVAASVWVKYLVSKNFSISRSIFKVSYSISPYNERYRILKEGNQDQKNVIQLATQY